jgi:predicted ATPase
MRAHVDMLTYAQASSHAFTLMRALYYAGLIHMGRREIAAAQQRAEAVLALSTKQGFGLNMGYATFLRGWALAAQGQREEGLAQMHQGLATTRAMGAILGET